MQSVESNQYQTFPPLPLSDLANRTARTPPPLQGSDPWFTAAKEVLLLLDHVNANINVRTCVPLLMWTRVGRVRGLPSRADHISCISCRHVTHCK